MELHKKPALPPSSRRASGVEIADKLRYNKLKLQATRLFELGKGGVEMPEGFSWFIFFWVFVLLFFMSIGGFFMFRKFLKVLPKKDGKSTLDWQNYYVEKSRPLWTEETKAFLDLLVSPVPKPFRDIAKHSIAAKIGQIALEEKAERITREHCLRGYILATPKRDHSSLKAFLDKKGIEYKQYESLFASSPK